MTTATARNGRARVPTIAPAEPQPAPLALDAANTELMAAILRVQAALPKLATNADGQVGGRSYRYADLGMVTDAALPLLVSEQLVWATFPTSNEHGQPALRYRMTHLTSGQFEEDVMLLMCAKPDPQGQGSALTYSRRYALCAVLNITVGDDDGAAASQNGGQNAGQNAESTAKSPASQPTAAPAKPSGRPATAPQRKMLRAKVLDAGLAIDDFANLIKEAAGEPAVQWQDHDAAKRWVDRALDRLPGRLVNPLVASIEGSRP